MVHLLLSGSRVSGTVSARSATGSCPLGFGVDARLASIPRPVTGRPLSENTPSLDEVLSACVRLRPPRCSGPLGFLSQCCSWWHHCLQGFQSLDRFSFVPFPGSFLAGSWWFQSHATLPQRDETEVPGLVKWGSPRALGPPSEVLLLARFHGQASSFLGTILRPG